jgi:glycine/D-amino acid oxidase-like deaminating enzyme
MIAPTTEAIDVDPEIASMGKHSLSLWPQWLAELPEPVFYRDNGTLLLWHREDAGEAVRAQRKFASQQSQIKQIDGARTSELEPVLGTRFPEVLYVPNEAQLDNRAFLKAVLWSAKIPSGGFQRNVTLLHSDRLPSEALCCAKIPSYFEALTDPRDKPSA